MRRFGAEAKPARSCYRNHRRYRRHDCANQGPPDEDRHFRGLNAGWATCPDEKYRDGKKAIEFAKRGCELTNWKDPFKLGTLAAGYAELGDITQAVRWQTQAIQCVSILALAASGNWSLAAEALTPCGSK